MDNGDDRCGVVVGGSGSTAVNALANAASRMASVELIVVSRSGSSRPEVRSRVIFIDRGRIERSAKS